MIGGKDTRADTMIAAAGGRDAGSEIGIEGFRPITAESLVAAQPDVILVPTARAPVRRRDRRPAADPGSRADARRQEPARARLRRRAAARARAAHGLGVAAARARPAPGAPLADGRAGSAKRAACRGGPARPAAALLAGLIALLAAALLLGVGVGAVRDRAGRRDRDRARTTSASTPALASTRRTTRSSGSSGCRGCSSARSSAARSPSPARRLQGVFRNPLADPGRSASRAARRSAPSPRSCSGSRRSCRPGSSSSAFAGGVVASLVVYALARYEGRTETVTLILTGVAVTAIVGAAIGLLIARADDAAAPRRRLLVARQPRRRDLAAWSARPRRSSAIGVAVACARRARARPDGARRARGRAPRRRHRAPR